MYNTAKNEDRICYVTKSDTKPQPANWQLKLRAIADRFDEFKKGDMKNIKNEFKRIDSSK